MFKILSSIIIIKRLHLISSKVQFYLKERKMSGVYEKAINSLKSHDEEYKFFQSLLYGTLRQCSRGNRANKLIKQVLQKEVLNKAKQSAQNKVQSQAQKLVQIKGQNQASQLVDSPLHHYNFYTRRISQCLVYLHQQHIGVLICVDRQLPGLRAYFNIKNMQISQFSYQYELDRNIKQNQYLVLKEKQDVAVLVFQDMDNRNYVKDYLEKLKRVLGKVTDYYDPLILKAFIKADTNQNGEISWVELKSLVRVMKVDLTKKIKDEMKTIIGRQKVETIDFSEFERLWKIFYCRNELIEVFQKYNREEFRSMNQLLAPKLDTREFLKFLIEQQKQTQESAKKTIAQLYETPSYALSFYDFCHYIFGPGNNLLNHQYMSKKVEMKKPLNHYYCYSSHNTYLTGDQLFSDSRVERYLVDLQNGLRCVEIDVHDGSEGPIVKHGYTPTSAILFSDVIESIKRFTDLEPSHTPIILSLEVHCNSDNQEQMADILIDAFKEKLLLIETKAAHFPTLEHCIGKIIVKGPGDFELFEKNQKHKTQLLDGQCDLEEQEDYQPQEWRQELNSIKTEKLSTKFHKSRQDFINRVIQLEKEKKEHFDQKKQFKKAKMEPTKIQQLLQSKNKTNNSLGSNKSIEKEKYHEKYKVSGALLSLICMLSKAKLQNPCCWESNSFSENKLKAFNKDAKTFDQIRSLSTRKWFRSYPDGLRILSSNYNPIPALQLGIQIVAINTQSKNDVNSHILKAFFTKSSRKTIGYRQKVHLDRRSEVKGNILTRAQNNLQQNQDEAISLTKTIFQSQQHKRSLIKAQIKFISGLRIYQNDQTNRVIPAVQIRAYFTGSQRDNKRNQRILNPKEYTQIVYNQAFNPKFNKIETLELKCVDPELGFVVVEVPECGRSVIPVDSLRPGWRVVSLFDEELKEKESKILLHIELMKGVVDVGVEE